MSTTSPLERSDVNSRAHLFSKTFWRTNTIYQWASDSISSDIDHEHILILYIYHMHNFLVHHIYGYHLTEIYVKIYKNSCYLTCLLTTIGHASHATSQILSKTQNHAKHSHDNIKISLKLSKHPTPSRKTQTTIDCFGERDVQITPVTSSSLQKKTFVTKLLMWPPKFFSVFWIQNTFQEIRIYRAKWGEPQNALCITTKIII